MKPKHNRVMCADCGKQKMLFESESKANNFIKWNGDDIDAHGGVLRAYYCPSCGGWHISHKEHKRNYDSSTDRLIEAYKRSVKTSDLKVFGSDKVLAEYDKLMLANDIWNSIPQEAKDYSSKNKVKKCITEYYKAHNIAENDGGIVRMKIYEKWYGYCYDKAHK